MNSNATVASNASGAINPNEANIGSITCSHFISRTIGTRRYAFSTNLVRWEDASNLCKQCYGTELANITSDVIFATLNEQPESFWISNYNGGDVVPYLVWSWGPNPYIVAFAPSDDLRRFVCNDNPGPRNRCIYTMAGTSLAIEDFLPWDNNTRTYCWIAPLLNDDGQSSPGSITHCTFDYSSNNISSPYYANSITTVNVSNSDSFVLIEQDTTSPLLNLEQVSSRFTHLAGAQNERGTVDGTRKWGIQSMMGTGRFEGRTGSVNLRGFIRAEISPSYEFEFDYFYVVQWDDPVQCF